MDAICAGGVSSCQSCGGLSGTPFPFGAYSDGKGGAGISALVGSWLVVFAVQDVSGGVCAVPSYLCSQNLCLSMDTVVSVQL